MSQKKQQQQPDSTPLIDPSFLIFNPRNPRTFKDEDFERLKKSIKQDPQFMELRPVIYDEQNIIIGGNYRLKACLELGMKKIPSNWIRQAKGLTEDQKKRFVVLDNSPSGISGKWDFQILTEDYKLPDLTAIGLELLADSGPNKWEDEWKNMPEYISENKHGYHDLTRKGNQRFQPLEEFSHLPS